MALYTNKSLLLVATKTAAGVVGDYVAIAPSSGAAFTPQADKLERNVMRPTLTPLHSAVGATHWTADIPLEIAGGGLDASVLQPPPIDALMKACAFTRSAGYVIPITAATGTFKVGESLQNTTQSEVVGTIVFASQYHIFVKLAANPPSNADVLTGMTSTATATSGVPEVGFCYAPSSDIRNADTAEIKFNVDGVLQEAHAARATFELNMEVGKYPTIKFSCTGLWVDPRDQVMPSNVTYNQTEPQRCVNMGLHLGDVDMSLLTTEKLAVTLANTINPIPDLNALDGRAAIDISGRKPTASVDPSATLLANFDPWHDWKNAVKYGVYAHVGETAGNRIWVVLPSNTNADTKTADKNGRVTYALGLQPGGDADNEICLFFT